MLYGKKMWLRPTPYTLGAYEGVVWAMSPLRVLKSRLIHVLRSCGRLKGVSESLQLTQPPAARVSFHVDALWIDYTQGNLPQARIQGTWSIRPETQGAFPPHEQVFDFKTPVKVQTQQGIFEAMEKVVDQWTRESAAWVLALCP